MKKKYLVVFIVLFSNCLCYSQWVQLGQDIDGEAPFDVSGQSVGLSSDGRIVAIGAIGNDGNGDSSGHVRVFERISGGDWIQVGQDIDGETSGDQSGYSLSLSSLGTTVAIGAYTNSGNGPQSGQVRVYENINNQWTQIGQDIDGEAPNDWSGISVSLNSDGSIVAIGAYANSNSNGSHSGHVRVYKNLNGVWVQIGQDIDGEAANDFSGHSVSLNDDGSIIAIGAILNDGNGSNSGHVRIYKYINEAWEQIGDDIDGKSSSDEFGYSVSLNNDGSIVAIGAINDAGYVSIFKNENNTWSQIGQDIIGEEVGDWSGIALSLSSEGSIVAIGARDNDGNGTKSGQVRIYQNEGGTWNQVGQDIDGENEFDSSGIGLCISSDGSIVAIGAAGNDGNGSGSGHVRVYGNETLGVFNSTNSNSRINFFPNPTKGVLNVKALNGEIQKIIILDISGKILIEKNNFSRQVIFDISNFSNGIYIIKVLVDDYLFTQKIVKE